MQVERKTLNTNPVATNSQFIASEVWYLIYLLLQFRIISFLLNSHVL